MARFPDFPITTHIEGLHDESTSGFGEAVIVSNDALKVQARKPCTKARIEEWVESMLIYRMWKEDQISIPVPRLKESEAVFEEARKTLLELASGVQIVPHEVWLESMIAVASEAAKVIGDEPYQIYFGSTSTLGGGSSREWVLSLVRDFLPEANEDDLMYKGNSVLKSRNILILDDAGYSGTDLEIITMHLSDMAEESGFTSEDPLRIIVAIGALTSYAANAAQFARNVEIIVCKSYYEIPDLLTTLDKVSTKSDPLATFTGYSRKRLFSSTLFRSQLQRRFGFFDSIQFAKPLLDWVKWDRWVFGGTPAYTQTMIAFDHKFADSASNFLREMFAFRSYEPNSPLVLPLIENPDYKRRTPELDTFISLFHFRRRLD